MTKNKIKKRNKTATIEKIIGVSRKMIEEKGYPSTSTNHIAKEANVSIGLIYKYFPNGKVDILKVISQREYEKLIDKNKIYNVSTKNFPEFLRALLVQILNQHRKNASLIAAMDIAFLSKKELFNDFEELIIGDLNPIPRILKKIPQFKSINIKSLEKKSKILIHTIDSIIHRHINYVNVIDTDEELIEFLVNLVLKILDFKI